MRAWWVVLGALLMLGPGVAWAEGDEQDVLVPEGEPGKVVDREVANGKEVRRLGDHTDLVQAPYALYTGLAAAALLLGLALYYIRVYRHPVVVNVARDSSTLIEFPLRELPEVDRALDRARRKASTLTVNNLPAMRWDRALKGAGTPVEVAAAFVEATGATLGQSLTENTWPLTLPPLRFRFGPRTTLMVVDGARLEEGQAQRQAAAIFQGGAGPSRVLVLDRTETQNAAKILREIPGGSFVVLSSNTLRDLLLAEHPTHQLEAAISAQIAVAELSPYRTAGGVEDDAFFFGRERELRTIGDQALRNFLVVGPRQMGKSTLLKALERRMKMRPDVEVRYVVLGGSDLVRHLVNHLEPNRLAGTGAGAALPSIEQVAAGRPERPLVWLIDEVDEFVRTDAKAGYPVLQAMRALTEERRAFFILAGFWDLYQAAVFDEKQPLRNFGESLRLEPLDAASALALATQPMKALGLSWDSTETTAHLLEQTGRRANLIVLACKGLIEALPADERSLTRAHLERVLQQDNDLRDQSRRWRGQTALHKAVVRQALLLGRPTREEIRLALQARGSNPGSEEFDRALDHRELSYVLVPNAEGRLHCPVPLMQRFIEAERSLELGLAEDLEDLRRGRSERPPAT